MAASTTTQTRRSTVMPYEEKPGEMAGESVPMHEDIAREAYELYLSRGCEDGHDVDDWLAAEEFVRNRRRQTSVAAGPLES